MLFTIELNVELELSLEVVKSGRGLKIFRMSSYTDCKCMSM